MNRLEDEVKEKIIELHYSGKSVAAIYSALRRYMKWYKRPCRRTIQYTIQKHLKSLEAVKTEVNTNEAEEDEYVDYEFLEDEVNQNEVIRKQIKQKRIIVNELNQDELIEYIEYEFLNDDFNGNEETQDEGKPDNVDRVEENQDEENQYQIVQDEVITNEIIEFDEKDVANYKIITENDGQDDTETIIFHIVKDD